MHGNTRQGCVHLYPIRKVIAQGGLAAYNTPPPLEIMLDVPLYREDNGPWCVEVCEVAAHASEVGA